MSNVLNPHSLEEIKGLMGEAFPTLVERFCVLSVEYTNSITLGVEANDSKMVADAAHPLKSSSRQLAADEVADLAANIESEAKNEQTITDDIREWARQLPIALEQANAALKAAC